MKTSGSHLLSVGFAGSRHLLPVQPEFSFETETDHAQAIESRLMLVLQRLPEKMGLPWNQPIEGVSQIAIGADTHFTRACARLGLRQRIFLPQEQTDFLSATDQDGTPDFDPNQRKQALELLSVPRITEVRIATNSRDRENRFIETNRAIVAASDVIICLLRSQAQNRPGGTLDLMEMARVAGKPLCEIRLSLLGDLLIFRETLHRFPD